MVTRIIYAFFLFLLLGLLSSSSCEKQEKKCSHDYKFEEPITIYLAKDTIHIDDSFYIEVNTPTNMHDLTDGKYIELKDHGIITHLHFYKILQEDNNREIDPEHPGYNGAISPNANDKFVFSSRKGKWTLIGNHGAKIEYDTLNGNFIHKTVVIAKDTGLFYLRFFDAIGYYVYSDNLRPNLANTDCYQYWSYMQYTVNNGITNNSILENRGITIRKNLGKTGDTQEYNFKHGSWSFVVVP